MSFDARLRNRCTHQVAFVAVALDMTTLRDIRLPYPVADARSFILHANRYDVREGDEGQFQFQLMADDLALPGRSKVRFVRPIRGATTFFFEASYTTSRDDCPRCHGAEVETDLRPDGRGGVETVVDEYKLVQELERFESVEAASMRFHPDLGTSLAALIGGKSINDGLTTSRVQLTVRRALESLRRLQGIQRKYQTVSPGEYLSELVGVSVSIDADDPTLVIVETEARALSGRSVGSRVLVAGD